MSVKSKHGRNLIILTLLMNSPPLLVWIPGLGLLFFLPMLFWINLPGRFLHEWVGEPHYDVQEFGVLPQTSLAWILIAAFWTLLAVGLTAVAAFLPELKWQFGLRTLLMIFTVLAILIGIAVYLAK